MGVWAYPGGTRALAAALKLGLVALIGIEPACDTRSTGTNNDAGPFEAAASEAAASDATDDAPSPDDAAVDDDGVGALPSLCRFDGPPDIARAVLAVALDGGIVLVMSDGSTRAVYQFTSVRPAPGVSFSVRLARLGPDIQVTGTWWGDGDPTSCESREGLLWCPETDRFVRISAEGEVTGEISRHVIMSSANVGGAPPVDVDAGQPGAPVVPVAPDPAAFTWVFPPGLAPMVRLIDSQGWFVAVLRDQARAGVYRSADAVSGWTRLGKTLGQVEQVLVRNVAGTYVIDALGTGSVFVPTQTWQDAPVGQEPELLQDSHQLVRPATGAAAVLDETDALAANVSSDGLCAASWEPTPSGRQLAVYDLTTNGARRPLLLEKVGIGSPASLWVE